MARRISTRRKDHAVANSRPAKEAIRRYIFRWIIPTRFSPKRFKWLYLSAPEEPVVTPASLPEATNDEPVVGGGKTRKEVEELSMKMLADVMVSLIGAAYLHSGFDHLPSCLVWDLSGTPSQIVWRQRCPASSTPTGVSTQLKNVELGIHVLAEVAARRVTHARKLSIR